MLLTIAGILFVLWLLGWAAHFGGDIIHILIVIALILYISNYVGGRNDK